MGCRHERLSSQRPDVVRDCAARWHWTSISRRPNMSLWGSNPAKNLILPPFIFVKNKGVIRFKTGELSHNKQFNEQGTRMFKELFNFSFRRNALQALGWYLSFFLLASIAGGIAGGIVGFLLRTEAGFHNIIKWSEDAGLIASLFMEIVLGYMLVKSRELRFLNILLVLIGALLSLLIGALGGLIPLAYLTTRTPSNKLA